MNYYVAFILKKVLSHPTFSKFGEIEYFCNLHFTVLPDPEYQYFE